MQLKVTRLKNLLPVDYWDIVSPGNHFRGYIITLMPGIGGTWCAEQENGEAFGSSPIEAVQKLLELLSGITLPLSPDLREWLEKCPQ